MARYLKWLHPTAWTTQKILLVATSFLIAFIPLFPKVPLADIIPGYIVRIRLEDILVMIVFSIWLMQVIRSKISWRMPLSIPFGLYIIGGLLSIVSAVFIIETVPLEPIHVGKTMLHYLRYIEYFTLCLIAFSSIKKKEDIQTVVLTLIFSFVVIGIYGLGQKYFLWPVYSTMNREFSKGIALQLTEHARVQSTFGGHYDLGAYLVLVAPLLFGLLLMAQHRITKWALLACFILATWLSVVSASRSSFAGFLISIYIVIALLAYIRPHARWKQTIGWIIKHGLWSTVVVAGMFMYFGGSLSERYGHMFEKYPQVVATYHQVNKLRKEIMYQYIPYYLGLKDLDLTGDSNTPSTPITPKPFNPVSPSDTRPVPSDVYSETPNKMIVVIENADGTQESRELEFDRNYSVNANKYGLSLAIRLDTLWPNAIKGFLTNPLLGSGYATLNKVGPTHNTEADSSDNNYLRTLGETGLLGFTTFYGTIIFAVVLCWRWVRQPKESIQLADILATSFIAGVIGLAVNALLIDVFSASKVAFIFWGLAGITLASIEVTRRSSIKQKSTHTQA